MGLLDDLYSDPNSMGLLSAGMGMMSAGGPSRMPVSLGQALGQGMQAGMGGYKAAYDMQKEKIQMDMLIRRQEMINRAMQGELGQGGQQTGDQQSPAGSPQAVSGSQSTGWPASKISAFAMSGDPGLMKAAEMEQARQLAGQTDITKLLASAGIDSNSILGRQIIQQQIAKQNNIAPTRLGEGAYATPDGGIQGLPSQAPAGYINQRSSDGTWKTVPVNGGLEAATTAASAIEGAKQGEKIEFATNASGAKIPVRLGSVVGGGTAQLQQPTDMGNSASFMFPGMTKQQILQQGAAISDPKERAAFFASLQSAPAQNINTGTPFDSMPKIQQPTGIGQTTYNEAIQKAQGAEAARLAEKYGTLADSANQRIALNNQALDLVGKSDIGPGATLTADMKSIIQKYVPGVSESSFENTPSATLALQKDLVNAATAKAKQQFGARITQSEVQLMLTRGSPNVSMPKAALQYLISSDNAAANYQIKQANDLGQYISQGGDPNRFEGWYAGKFPMTDATSQVHLGAAGATPGTQSAAPQPKTATLADIAATAKASGRSTAEVTKALKAKGYTIGGI